MFTLFPNPPKNPQAGSQASPQVAGANGLMYSQDMLDRYGSILSGGGSNALDTTQMQGALMAAGGDLLGYQNMVNQARGLMAGQDLGAQTATQQQPQQQRRHY